MTPAPLDEAIVRAVDYAAMFEYPLTLGELRASVTEPVASIDHLRSRLAGNAWLGSRVRVVSEFVVPVGRADLIGARRRREATSRQLLERHRRTLRCLGSVPFVRALAISGSLAWLNADKDGDLDLFVVARDGRVWTAATLLIVTARLLGQRRVVCANLIVGESALTFPETDQFTAHQILGLRPIGTAAVRERLLAANPAVRRWFPNVESLSPYPELRGGSPWVQTLAEALCRPWGDWLERLCQRVYRRHLLRRRAGWSTPEQVRLETHVLKLHTHSHRARLEAGLATSTVLTRARYPRSGPTSSSRRCFPR